MLFSTQRHLSNTAHTSSSANRTPPMGAPKAAATPAAAPQLTKSRFALSVRNMRMCVLIHGREVDLPCIGRRSKVFRTKDERDLFKRTCEREPKTGDRGQLARRLEMVSRT
ncbi:hypothetical protein SARC_16177, partial [Sphaeroforma arctica JP610]